MKQRGRCFEATVRLVQARTGMCRERAHLHLNKVCRDQQSENLIGLEQAVQHAEVVCLQKGLQMERVEQRKVKETSNR